MQHGHCNGTRYMIIDMTNILIEVQKVIGGEHSNILIPRIPIISESSSFPGHFKQTQFPVLGAYYLTINRAQGQTLFCYGMIEACCLVDIYMWDLADTATHEISLCMQISLGSKTSKRIFMTQKFTQNMSHILS